MEQNLPVLPKKVWSLLRIFYFMLRKGISKRKLWLDLNMMMKRAKILGKTLQNLMFHHHHQWAAFATNHPSHHLSCPSPPSSENEFSCTASPSNDNHNFSLFPVHKKDHHLKNQQVEDLDVVAFNVAVLKAMEVIRSETASPALPGFGRSPMVRQLRITDSPFPLNGVEEDNQVDEAAEQFISRFYNDLRRQNMKAPFGSCSPMK
ncbi:unnamed protein product [Lactuca virosa]|uniref:Avr9/Cf-9 rapidly elicited protein 146 n=1 Tax=Lactuca virosa TaxID=75947 RepID=A0AAU9M0U4_9ASTR|nr:unnamed protein product [Lactuca virosa]